MVSEIAGKLIVLQYATFEVRRFPDNPEVSEAVVFSLLLFYSSE